jgi:hypothetical protein
LDHLLNKRNIPYELAALVYRLLRRAVRRAVRVACVVSIAGAMTLIDFVFNRDRPKISFEHLSDNRYDVYFLFALTRVGPVGCSPRDAPRAFKWMPIRDFLASVRINWRAPTDGGLLSERQGPDILYINREYYSLPPLENRLFAPYFAHPEFYKAGLQNAVLAMRWRERNIKIFFAGTHSDSRYSENFRFPILSRDKILRHVIEKFERVIRADADKSGVKLILFVLTK